MSGITHTAVSLASRYTGLRELPGADHNARIVAMLQRRFGPGQGPQDDETPWPLVGDTEILTTRGWVRFDALAGVMLSDPSLRVMQVNPDSGVASLTTPRVIERPYAGDLHVFERRGLMLGCSPQHEFYAEWGNRGLRSGRPLARKPVSALREKMCLPLVRGYEPERPSPMTLKDVEFLAAYLADGNLKDQTTVQFNVSREDKKERLRAMGPVGVYERTRLYGKNKVPATNYTFRAPPGFHSWLTGPKVVAWDIVLAWTAAQRRAFVNTYRFFDGHTQRCGGEVVCTTSRHLIDLLQSLLFLDGYRVSWASEANSFEGVPTQDLFRLHYSNSVNSMTVARDHRRIEPFSGRLYCVTVPHGAFVARAGQMAFVSANCSAFVGEVAWLLGLPEPASEWLRARSWLTVGTPVLLEDAQATFDVVILNRAGGPQDPAVIKAPGHVGFYFGHTAAEISILGGNQGNRVSVKAYPRSALLGVRRLWSPS